MDERRVGSAVQGGRPPTRFKVSTQIALKLPVLLTISDWNVEDYQIPLSAKTAKLLGELLIRAADELIVEAVQER